MSKPSVKKMCEGKHSEPAGGFRLSGAGGNSQPSAAGLRLAFPVPRKQSTKCRGSATRRLRSRPRRMLCGLPRASFGRSTVHTQVHLKTCMATQGKRLGQEANLLPVLAPPRAPPARGGELGVPVLQPRTLARQLQKLHLRHVCFMMTTMAA